MTLGEALVSLLETHGVEVVFGIPGVHTIELYRGLAASRIRHVTPRHEQGAGFMADGYARVSGKPGVVFVITGPGLTNVITAMAQARADSVPMLVISGVNATPSLGKGLGALHELPDQRGMMEKMALFSHRIMDGAELPAVLNRAFTLFATGRPGPVHIEVPLDIMGRPAEGLAPMPVTAGPPAPEQTALDAAGGLVDAGKRPLILAGGGARHAEAPLRALAERLDAPVVTTANARGLMHGHPLAVHASPSLPSVRKLMAEADLVIAAGTEFGPTDYDMYVDGGFVLPANLVRIDIDAAQLARRPATVSIQADCAAALEAMLAGFDKKDDQAPPLRFASQTTPRPARGRGNDGGDDGSLPLPRRAGERWPAQQVGVGVDDSGATHALTPGARRAAEARNAAWAELEPYMHPQIRAVEAIRDALPGAILVGDSTQPVYAANLCYDHDRPGGWFNAATGYGALGYGPPAAIGAAIAAPGVPVVCLAGDGGLQFTLAEIGAAADARAPVIFVVWNNRGYREIEIAMKGAGVEPVGVSPAPPDFTRIAEAYGLAAEKLAGIDGLPDALRRAWGTGKATGRPALIEIAVG
jgi:acetolactate synthase-1/2/3 large subunit